MLKTIGALLVAAGIIAILWFILVVPFTGWHRVTNNGQHVGYVTAVEQTGVFFKTDRAYIKTDTQSSQEDSYCVVDDGIYKSLEFYSREHSRVQITYLDWFARSVTECDGETGGVIVGVMEVQ